MNNSYMKDGQNNSNMKDSQNNSIIKDINKRNSRASSRISTPYRVSTYLNNSSYQQQK